MIDKSSLESYITGVLEGSPLYLVEVKVSPSNEITVEVDSDAVVDIEECVALSRKIEEAFNRDEEDYELEVGSAGLTSPLKVPRQYRKYLGCKVELVDGEGKKVKGLLTEADDEGFTVRVEEKYKPEGAKRPAIREAEKRYGYGDVKRVQYLLEF